MSNNDDNEIQYTEVELSGDRRKERVETLSKFLKINYILRI